MKKPYGTMVMIMLVAVLIGTFLPAKHAAAREIGREGRFIAYDNGTVFDTQTNLMWAAKDNGSDINWENAKRYCQNYRGGGYKDWRTPTMDELAGLYNRSVKGKNGYKLSDLIELTGCCPWASERRGSEAACFYFHDGTRSWNDTAIDSANRVLPVRSGKSPAGTGSVSLPKPLDYQVVANSDSRLYHLPGMKYYKSVLSHHRVIFPSEEAARKAGYRKAPR